MITPFDKEEDLNLEDLNRLVENFSQHVQSLFIYSSYGSGSMMPLE